MTTASSAVTTTSTTLSPPQRDARTRGRPEARTSHFDQADLMNRANVQHSLRVVEIQIIFSVIASPVVDMSIRKTDKIYERGLHTS